MNCESCAHWQINGTCHRNPPQTIWTGAALVTVWPKTKSDDGCGEYEHKSSALISDYLTYEAIGILQQPP